MIYNMLTTSTLAASQADRTALHSERSVSDDVLHQTSSYQTELLAFN